MADILFKHQDYVFSYRVAGICIQNGMLLLQKPTNDDGYAFPGGHVAFGEIHAETLTREFKEEIGVDVTVGELKWVGEIFFPWGTMPCHQICLYYMVEIQDGQVPMSGSFVAREHLEGRDFDVVFYWIPLDKVKNLKIYPTNAQELLAHLNDGTQHFVYREDEAE